MKKIPQNKTIWTIGHSTCSLEELAKMLPSFQMEKLVDIRSYPGSWRHPHFNKDALEISLPQNNIQYIHLKDLGGRRKGIADSKNTTWRHIAFQGYADYMETDEFKKAISALEEIALKQRTAYMCSEAVWWGYHRVIVSEYLKVRGWRVIHIMNTGKAEEHPYTARARISKWSADL